MPAPNLAPNPFPVEPRSGGGTFFEALSLRAHALADAVEACSRRRDVRETRSAILLVLLGRTCPLGRAPRVPWYVPGAAARTGAAKLVRELARRGLVLTERTVLRHLGELERAALLARQPGDYLAPPRAGDIRRPRWADTIHVLGRPWERVWWDLVGRARLAAEPLARRDPRVWRRLFGSWREEARASRDALLRGTITRRMLRDAEAAGPLFLAALGVAPGPMRVGRDPVPWPEERRRRVAAELCSTIARSGWDEPRPVLELLDRCGVQLRGFNRRRAICTPRRLAGAAALFALSLRTGRDRIRRKTGWLWRAFLMAGPGELAGALEAAAWIARHERTERWNDARIAPPTPPARAALDVRASSSAGTSGSRWSAAAGPPSSGGSPARRAGSRSPSGAAPSSGSSSSGPSGGSPSWASSGSSTRWTGSGADSSGSPSTGPASGGD